MIAAETRRLVQLNSCTFLLSLADLSSCSHLFGTFFGRFSKRFWHLFVFDLVSFSCFPCFPLPFGFFVVAQQALLSTKRHTPCLRTYEANERTTMTTDEWVSTVNDGSPTKNDCILPLPLWKSVLPNRLWIWETIGDKRKAHEIWNMMNDRDDGMTMMASRLLLSIYLSRGKGRRR